MSQSALAEAARTAPKNVWQIERRRANPTHDTLEAIADVLFVPAEALLIRARVIRDDRLRDAASANGSQTR